MWKIDAKAELQERIEALDQAILKGDLKAVQTTFDNDGVFVGENGKVVNQQTFVAGILNKDTTYKSVKSTPDALHIFGDTAIETGIFKAAGTLKGKPLNVHVRYTATWLKRNGKWRVIAEQDMTLSKDHK